MGVPHLKGVKGYRGTGGTGGTGGGYRGMRYLLVFATYRYRDTWLNLIEPQTYLLKRRRCAWIVDAYELTPTCNG